MAPNAAARTSAVLAPESSRKHTIVRVRRTRGQRRSSRVSSAQPASPASTVTTVAGGWCARVTADPGIPRAAVRPKSVRPIQMLDKLGSANRTQAGLLAHDAGIIRR